MSANRASYLVAAFLSVLASHGLDADTLDPWRGWVAFKQFTREVAEVPDHGVSVQIIPLGHRAPIRLAFVRQALEPAEDKLEPIGGVVCVFEFAPRRHTPAEWSAWSFDSSTFERFVDLVEQHPVFADLLLTKPLSSGVYWEEA